jgi:beta-xylosidase
MKKYYCMALGAIIAQLVFADNPVMRGADPGILLVDDTVYMYPTSRRTQFFAYSSNDLVTWQTQGPILDFAKIDWISDDKSAWAPGIIKKNGTYYFYYSVGPKPSHIGVAYSNSPTGPFVDSGRPLLSDNGDPSFEAIDAMVFTDPNSGKSYLYAGGSAGAKLRLFELNNTMTSFAREIPVTTPPNFTEGVFMHCRNGIYYLSYSHGQWRSDTYSVHYAMSKTPFGPWNYQGAILVSDNTYKGPGHHSFLYNSAMNEWYIFYHRWEKVKGSGPYSGSRVIAIEYLEYEDDGRIKPVTMTGKGVDPVRSFKGNPEREN